MRLPVRTKLAAGLALLLAVLLSSDAMAQRISVGVKAGTSTSTFSGDADTDFRYRTTFAAGVHLRFRLTDMVGVQPEVLYVLKGAQTDEFVSEGEPLGIGGHVSIAYIEVPVLFVADVPVDWTVRPRMLAGLWFAYKIDAKDTFISPVQTATQDDESVANTDYGVAVGGGFSSRALANQLLALELRAVIGAPDIRNRPDRPLRNTAFEVLLSFSF